MGLTLKTKSGRIPVHKSVTLDRVVDLVEQQSRSLEDPGICLFCGVEASGVEPDARRYKCESCGEHYVYGAEQLLIMLS